MFSRSSVGEIGVNIREDTETSILIKRTFWFLAIVSIFQRSLRGGAACFRLKVRGERLKARIPLSLHSKLFFVSIGQTNDLYPNSLGARTQARGPAIRVQYINNYSATVVVNVPGNSVKKRTYRTPSAM